MQDIHDPSPEFTRFLEWQTRTAVRRAARFGAEVRAPRAAARFAKIAAVVVASVLAGASAVVAAEHIQEGRELRLHLETNRIQLELAERRVERAERERVRVAGLRDEGLVGDGEFARAAGEVLEATVARDHAALERDEMVAARRMPDRAITAPVIGRRDFVAEHLMLDIEHASGRVDRLAKEAERVAALAGMGAVSLIERERSEARVEEARRGLALEQAQLDLRTSFVQGAIDAETCVRQAVLLPLESRREGLAATIDRTQSELELARERYRTGLVPSRVVDALEARLEEERAELEMVEAELEFLGS